MSQARIRAFVRHFPENGMKLLLEHPGNVEDLLRLTGTELADLIDFRRLKRDPTTYVERDYRHVESDLVLVAPLKGARSQGKHRKVLIYVLIEHQSEADVLMPFRLIEYVVMIYKSQLRAWARKHGALAGFRFQPVLPIVFYTGTRPWDAVGRLVDLVELGRRFERFIPIQEPLFVNLPALPAARLETEGGYFGWVLRLVQDRHARPEKFEELLERVVEHLEQITGDERLRWLELLSYVHALVYHERNDAEIAGYQRLIEASVETDSHRKEVAEMGKTCAEVLQEKGMKKGELRALRRNLVELLQERFGELPKDVTDTIKATTRVRQLEKWLKGTVKAKSLEELEIAPTS